MKTMTEQTLLVRLGVTAESLCSIADGGLDLEYEMAAIQNARNLLRLITDRLDGKEWSPDVLEAIADLIRSYGIPVRDFEDDTGLTAEQLAAKYDEHDGGWGDHPRFDRAEWLLGVCSRDTQLGYWDWVVSQIEQEANDG